MKASYSAANQGVLYKHFLAYQTPSMHFGKNLISNKHTYLYWQELKYTFEGSIWSLLTNIFTGDDGYVRLGICPSSAYFYSNILLPCCVGRPLVKV